MSLLSACRTFARLHTAQRDFDRAKRKHELTYLFWEATLGCNLTCRHCGSRCAPELAGRDDLPGGEVQRILREMAEDFDARKITIAVTGGEPLTRPDVFTVMKAARDLGFYWGMVTNATLITPRTIKEMERSGMGTVSVSIDGDERAHAVLRGSTQAFRQAMAGLRLLVKDAGFLECVQVTSVIGKHNIGILDELYGRFADLGVGEWRILMLDPIGRMQDPANRELLLDGQELSRLLDFVAAKRPEDGMPVTFEESGFLGLKYEGAVRGHYFHCPAGINIASLLHDGAISACPSLDRRMAEGDARRERFSEVWNGRFARYRDREGTRRKGPCADCRWWRHCEGGSLHLWDWDKAEPRLCHYHMLKDAGGL